MSSRRSRNSSVPEHIATYNTNTAAAKIVLIIAAVLVLLLVWFGVRFQLGDLFSEITPVSDPQADEIADSAASLSPSNPRAFWLKGAVSRKGFDQQSVDGSIASFTDAARLGPNHFRWWTELGRAREQNGDIESAEKAYRRAVELAPGYTSPRWQLGNFFLRQGRNEQAIAELAAAAEHSALYRGQVYGIAWNFFGKDVRAVERFANDKPESRVSLALFYASQNRPEDAIRNWNVLGEEQKSNFRRDAETAAKTLLNLHSYAGALEFSRQSGIDPAARPEAVTSGDFESAIKERDQPMFDWAVGKRDGKLEISLDGRVKSGGTRSLRMTFRGYVAPWLESVSQTLATVRGRRYKIGYAYRTEELRGGSLPRIEILNAADNQLVAASAPFLSGTNDWQQVHFEFTGPENLDGVVVKVGREPCSGECPLVGVLWIDDIVLTAA